MSNSKPPLYLILDFDHTITTTDTDLYIFSIPLSHPKSPHYQSPSTSSPSPSPSTIPQAFLDAWLTAHRSHITNYHPPPAERTTLDQVIAFQRSLHDLEVASFERVSASGFLRGLGPADWQDVGRRAVRVGDVKVRPGFAELVRHEGVARWGIVSVNFQRDFVRGVVTGAGAGAGVGGLGVEKEEEEEEEEEEKEKKDEESGKELVDPAKQLRILAHGSGPDGRVRGPEEVGGAVSGDSAGKLRMMEWLLGHWTQQDCADAAGTHHDGTGLDSGPPPPTPPPRRPGLVVYVGDSGTDIECLTASGVLGIVMLGNEQADLLQVLRRAGVRVRHVEDGGRELLARRGEGNGKEKRMKTSVDDGGGGEGKGEGEEGMEEKTILWARNFEEITRGLF